MTKKNHQSSGFTLIELLVVIVILAILIVMFFMVINIFSQIDKAKDAQRKRDFGEIRNALDTYYNDNNCYPTSVPFGSSWTVGTTVYMKKVPQDPDCSRTGYCYIYQADQTSACPQWNVLYTRLSRPTNSLSSCQTYQVCNYLNVKYNFCVFSGNIDCSYIRANPLPNPVVPTPGGGATSTPTPTPGGGGVCSCATAQYDIRAGRCNLVSAPPFNYCDVNCTQPCQP